MCVRVCVCEVCQTDCIVEGEVLKYSGTFGGTFGQSWPKKHLKLYPNRLEFYQKNEGYVLKGKGVEVGILS